MPAGVERDASSRKNEFGAKQGVSTSFPQHQIRRPSGSFNEGMARLSDKIMADQLASHLGSKESAGSTTSIGRVTLASPSHNNEDKKISNSFLTKDIRAARKGSTSGFQVVGATSGGF